MGDKKTHISVDIAVEDIRAALKKLICSDHSQLIGDVIIDNLLETDVGVKQLYLAMSGVREILKFKALDEVYIKYDYLYTWKMNKTKMEEEGLIFQGKVKGKIIGINGQKQEQYLVQYNYAGSAGVVMREEIWLNEARLAPCTDQEIIEGDDNLPF